MKKIINFMTILVLVLALGITCIACGSKDKVTVSLNSVSLEVGQWTNITATASDNSTITWSSSDSAIATVDNTGKITGVSSGNATITAASATAKATVKVTVTASTTQITISKTSLTLEVGQSELLTASISDGSTLSWISSDSRIATVDANGQVTAVAAGVTMISATNGAKYASCQVTVNAKSVSVDSVKNELLTLIDNYKTAKEVSFKLKATSDKTQTTDVQYHLGEDSIIDFAYALTGTTKASLYVKDNTVYLSNLNGDNTKGQMALTAEESEKIATNYTFDAITSKSLSWALEDAFWNACSLTSSDSETAELSLDLKTYTGTAINVANKTAATLTINYTNGTISSLVLAFTTTEAKNTSITVFFNGLANVTIDYPALDEYN